MWPGPFLRRGCRGLLGLALASAFAARGVEAGPGEVLLRLRTPAPADTAAFRGPTERAIDALRARHPELSDLARAHIEPLLPAGRVALVAALPAGLSAGAGNRRGAAPPANPIARTLLVRLPIGSDAGALARRLSALPEVELAVPNRTLAIGPLAGAVPRPRASGERTDAGAPERAVQGAGDPRRNDQWYLDRVGVETAWAVTRGSPAVLIAIIDTGVSAHPDLTPSLWPNDDPPGNGSPADDALDQDGSGAVEDWERADDDDNGYVDDAYGYDFVDAPRIGGPGDAIERDADPADDSGHGTAVAGVVGAAAENGIGIAGLAPDCRLMIVRAGFNPGLGLFSGVLEEDDAAAAIVYAAENGARVINLSFGDTIESPIVSDAVAYARALGAVIVASGGNQGTDGPHFPSALPGVIAVGATNRSDERAAFSSYGPNLDLVAPGESILTTAFEDDYVALSGTSFSAPLVAAAAGLLLSHAPDLAPSQVEGALWGTARDLGFPGLDLATGHGRLDSGRALTVPREGSVALLAPGAGSGVDGQVPIVVTAEGLGIERYVIDAGAGREPAAFATLHEASGTQVVADTVAIWDASGLAAGEYTLRLRAEDAYEGMLETRTLVEVDHSPPAISDLAVEVLWTEDRRTPFVCFATDDLARGSMAITLPESASGVRTITGAYRTREHTLRFPDDLAPGFYAFAPGAVNAAGLHAGPAAGVAPVSGYRAMTHALAATGRVLPPCEVAPRALDLDQDGALDLVAMLDQAGTTFGPLAVFGDSSGTLVERARLPHALLPRDVGDSDGDGRMEILASGAATAVLLESPAQGAMPSVAVWEDPTGFAIGFATLSGAPVILGIRSDSLLVWRATGDASAWSREAHANFVVPLASLGPTFFVGDVDQDGAAEVVVGDGAGNLLAYRETASGLVPGYAMALPAAASPLVSGGDWDLDGRPEVMASVPIGLDATSEAAIDRRRHELLVLTADPARGFEVIGGVGVAGAEPRGNVLRVANLDSDSAPEILFVAAPDLYVFDRQSDGTLFPIDHEPGFRSLSLAVADLDGDGRMDVFATAGDQVRELEARDPSLLGPPPPAGLRARIAADGAIELEWNAGNDRFRLYRTGGSAVDCGTTPILAEVAAPSYRDTTALELPIVTYRVSAVDAGVEGECSPPLVVAREEAPRLLSASADGRRAVRVRFSAAMDASASELGSYVLVDSAGAPIGLSSVISVEGEHGRQLVLAADLAPGAHGLRVGGVRSIAGVSLAGPDSLGFQVALVPSTRPLHLVRAVPAAAPAEVLLTLSAPPEVISGSDPASFSLAGGFAIVGASVESTAVRLSLDPATPLRPGAFLVQLAPGLRGAGGERVVPGEGDRTELVVGGELVAYPNPYDVGRATGDGVTFAGLEAGDEIVLLDALGREISPLNASPRGTAYLTVRGRPEFASGIYLFRVAGPGGVRIGKLAIRR